MKRRLGLAALCGLLLTVLTMSPWRTIAERPAAADSSPPGGTAEVLAIVSPIVYPVCSASGLSTLLVPVVGGLLENDFHLPPSVSISDVILNALGPVFVVCGDLPAPAGCDASSILKCGHLAARAEYVWNRATCTNWIDS